MLECIATKYPSYKQNECKVQLRRLSRSRRDGGHRRVMRTQKRNPLEVTVSLFLLSSPLYPRWIVKTSFNRETVKRSVRWPGVVVVPVRSITPPLHMRWKFLHELQCIDTRLYIWRKISFNRLLTFCITLNGFTHQVHVLLIRDLSNQNRYRGEENSPTVSNSHQTSFSKDSSDLNKFYLY